MLCKFQHHLIKQYCSFPFCHILWIAVKRRRIYLLTYLETTWDWPQCMAGSCLRHVPHSPQDALSHFWHPTTPWNRRELKCKSRQSKQAVHSFISLKIINIEQEIKSGECNKNFKVFLKTDLLPPTGKCNRREGAVWVKWVCSGLLHANYFDSCFWSNIYAQCICTHSPVSVFVDLILSDWVII